MYHGRPRPYATRILDFILKSSENQISVYFSASLCGGRIGSYPAFRPIKKPRFRAAFLFLGNRVHLPRAVLAAAGQSRAALMIRGPEACPGAFDIRSAGDSGADEGIRGSDGDSA
jgi:hypothetical protein